MDTRKKYSLILTFLLVTMVFTGCFGSKGVVDTPASARPGMLTATVFIPPQLQVGEIQALSQIAATTVQVTLTNDTITHEQVVPVNANQAELVFDQLLPGWWSVDVAVLDHEEIIVASGTTSAQVIAAAMSAVTLQVSLEPGDLVIQLMFPDDLPVTSGTATIISLVNPDRQQQLDIQANSATTLFTEVDSGTWPVQIELYGQDLTSIASGECPVHVPPGRTTTAHLTYDVATGGIELSVVWLTPPAVPTGVMAIVDSDRVLLSWDSNTESNLLGYAVYRREAGRQRVQLLTDALLLDTVYVDTTVEHGQSYSYWIQAYNEDGLSSGLSLPAVVDMEDY